VSLVEQNVLWAVPGVILALFMVYAMMEYTVVLIDGEPRPRPGPFVTAAELRRRLLTLNEPGAPHRLAEHADIGMLVHWDPVDPAWRAKFAYIKLSDAYGVRMLFDETRREARWYEWSRTSNIFVGVDGARPRFNFPATYAAGDLRARTYRGVAYGVSSGWFPAIEDVREFSVDVAVLRARIADIIADGRWTMRSTHIWLQTRPSLFHLTEALVPEAIRRLPRQRFWGIVYPASHALAIAALWAAGGAVVTAGNIGIVAGVAIAWWGLWGLLVWAALSGRPTGRRAQRRP
jgi:hypothetical protein